MAKTNADIIRKYLMETEREGMADLLDYMAEIGFLTAPCSGSYHLAKEGGLAEHSVNVLEYADKLASKWLSTEEYKKMFPSIVICSLLHDLGKCGDFGKANYVPNKLKSGELSSAKPYKTNPDLLYIDHEIRSIKIAAMFIDLTEEEEHAILYHNGLYGNLKYAIQGKETPLYMIIHFADMWASRVVETGKKED